MTITLTILAAFWAAPCGAEEPMEALKPPVEEVLAILKDSRYQSDEHKAEQLDRLHRVIRELFDFTEIAKRTLARNWRSFTPQQRKAFSEVFAELLENTYTGKIRGEFQDEKIVFLEQEMLSERKSLVRSHIVRETTEVPVDYRMILKKDGWRVYDVIVEGISLVQNYRTQFDDILVKESPAQLIERLEKKVAELQTQPNT
jgi:phospholipid transport system substrate-binding protein